MLDPLSDSFVPQAVPLSVRDRAIHLRAIGLSYAQIARHTGLSAAAVVAILEGLRMPTEAAHAVTDLSPADVGLTVFGL